MGERGIQQRGLTGLLLRTNRYTNCNREHIYHKIDATIWGDPAAPQSCLFSPASPTASA